MVTPFFIDLMRTFEKSYQDTRGKQLCLDFGPSTYNPMFPEEDNSWRCVIKDIMLRDYFGKQKYKKYLHKNTTEDTLQHAYEEALDLTVYLKTELLKREEQNESK